MKVLVTGAGGFIGFHLVKKLLLENIEVIGIDNLNNYYDVNLKNARISELERIAVESFSKFTFRKIDLVDFQELTNIFKSYEPNIVINLAAQAGVRYSIENASAYIQSNLVGFTNILEACRKIKVSNFIYASSSSVYGGNISIPFSEDDGVNHPVSLYAATKRSNELIAHAYSHLYKIPSIGLRFFTVYGPWGRPDMALFIFTKKILSGEEIEVFNNGEMIRDFTYIDDIVESLFRLIDKPPKENNSFDLSKPKPSNSWCAHKIFNIGNSKPTPLNEYIEAIEHVTGKKAIKKFKPMQKGDVKVTSADTTKLEEYISFKPNTSINTGVAKFVNWYKDYYSID